MSKPFQYVLLQVRTVICNEYLERQRYIRIVLKVIVDKWGTDKARETQFKKLKRRQVGTYLRDNCMTAMSLYKVCDTASGSLIQRITT